LPIAAMRGLARADREERTINAELVERAEMLNAA
jgi:hypothetical protein